MKSVTLVLVALLVAGSAGGRAQGVDQKDAAAIMKADADFNQALADRDLKRFLSFVGEPATFNGGTPEEVHGRDAVAKDWARYFQDNGPRLTWKPTKAEILGHGDLGYTVGSWELRAPPAGGQAPAVTRGNYLTVWKKQADGAWRIVFDTGSTFESATQSDRLSFVLRSRFLDLTGDFARQAFGRDDAGERTEAENPPVQRTVDADVERHAHAAGRRSATRCDGCHCRART